MLLLLSSGSDQKDTHRENDHPKDDDNGLPYHFTNGLIYDAKTDSLEDGTREDAVRCTRWEPCEVTTAILTLYTACNRIFSQVNRKIP